MCEKQNYEGSRIHTSTSLEGTLLASCQNHKAHCDSKEQMGRRSRSNTRGFLRKCQPPACQGIPGGNNRQERNDAVSGQEDGKRREDYCGGQDRSTKMTEGGYVLPQRAGAKGKGALGVKSPLFHHTCGKTT